MSDVEKLKEALKPFAQVADWAERNGHDLEKDFDMLLRGPGNRIAGHLNAQAPDFLRAKQVLEELDRRG